MRIAIVDESASRASIIQEGLAEIPDSELFVLTERHGLGRDADPFAIPGGE